MYVHVKILTPFLLRRLKTDVEFSLPPKKEILVYAPLTRFQVLYIYINLQLLYIVPSYTSPPPQEKYYKSLLDHTIFELVEDNRRKRMLEAGVTDGKEEEGTEEGETNGGCRERRHGRKRKTVRYTANHIRIGVEPVYIVVTPKSGC